MIGVFGGTFDPPHIGHLILAESALEELGLEAVLWVLTPRSPLKPDGDPAAVDLRLRMMEAAIEGNPRFRLSKVDVDRDPPYYTIGTLESIRAADPKVQPVLLLGSDALEELPRWHEPRRLVELCAAIGVMTRPGYLGDVEKLNEEIPGLSAKLRTFRAPSVEISAREIRRRLHAGQSIRYLVPEAVRKVIEQEAAYRRGDRG